jgi:hypothetical protein
VNRICLVLFDMNNRKFGPYLAATQLGGAFRQTDLVSALPRLGPLVVPRVVVVVRGLSSSELHLAARLWQGPRCATDLGSRG